MQFSDTDAPAPAAPAVPQTPLVLAPAPPAPRGRLGRLSTPPSPSAPLVAAPAPQTVPAGRLSTLQPVPGGKPEPVVRPAYGGRHYGGGFRRGGGYQSPSGGDTSKGDAIAYGQLTGVMRDVEQLKDEASRAAAKGDQAGAQSILGRARALTEMARQNPNYRDKVEVGESDGWPYIKLRSAPTSSAQPSRPRSSSSKHDPLGLY